MVLAVVVAGIVIVLLLPVWINPRLGVQNDPRITKLIYPTLGNPAMVKAGSSLVLEYDPREQDFDDAFEEANGFKVKVKSSNGPGMVKDSLPVQSVKVGFSSQWPEYVKDRRQDRRIYLLTVTVPRDLPRDLYDVTVTASIEDLAVADTQPHALAAIDAFKDDFTFLQLTDVHVWGPEIEYPSCTHHERSARPNGLDPRRKGAVYYQKAIDQINMTRPDFVVLSGDCMFGQKYFVQDNGRPWGETTEYQYEMLWFYQETLRLDVPVYIVMGNHDSYNEGFGGAHEDWFANWRKLYGPVYHSFDYGDYHFVAANSQDWAAAQRVLFDWEGIMLQPGKYKGQLMKGGDKSGEGITLARLRSIDETKFKGQLAWIRDDLKAHMGSRMRIMVMHHDPYKKGGSGEMWGEAAGGGLVSKLKFGMTKLLGMGDGQGRLAMMDLMCDYNVGLEISGHDHSDYVATRAEEAKALGDKFVDVFTWTGGGGEVKYVNTTSTQFQTGGDSNKYPGYRKIHIAGGQVVSYNYKQPDNSYPWYEGTNVGGVTNLGKLTVPAISAATGAPDSDGASIEFKNTLEAPLPGAFRELVLPYLSDGHYYTVEGSRIGAAYREQEKDGAKLVLQVLSDVPAVNVKDVIVSKSAAPDRLAPSGSVTVEPGATTVTTSVTLRMSASDAGGAGVRDMMVSNSQDFKDAVWEPYRPVADWTLAGGAAGPRTVYVRFRDGAMPGNESAVVNATVSYDPGR
jgi:3',5'-cyclic AMP phosphodiesterase CpdA